MSLKSSSIHIEPDRLHCAIAVAEDAVHNGPYPWAVLAVANADATVLTHVVSHPKREPVRAGTERRLWRTAPWLITREEIWAVFY